jgi:DNA polymerase III subunit beta
MKLQVSRSILAQALQKVQSITEKKTNMPVLANTLLEVEESGIVRFSATDLELSYRTQAEAQVSLSGKATVSARKLLEIVRELPQESINLETLPNERLAITAGRSYFELGTIPVEDFPHLTFYEDSPFISFEAAEIKDCLEKTLYVIPSEDDPFSIAGLFWHPLDTELFRFVASDGHRLAYMQASSSKFHGIQIKEGIIIPRKGVQEMLRMLESNSEFELGISENCLMVKTGDAMLAIRLLEEEFPEYHEIIPQERPFSIQIDRMELLQALKRMATLTNQKWRHVRLTISEGTLLLESGNPEIGNANDELDVEFAGEPFTVAFNIRYLLEAIQCMGSQKIRFEWVDNEHGGVITGAEDLGYLSLVMPMII